jgi:hypothetical protein
MSIMSVYQAMIRIKDADQRSPIAIFKCEEKGDQINAVFASTVRTQTMIKSGDENYIGSYHRGMDLALVRRSIEEAISLRTE